MKAMLERLCKAVRRVYDDVGPPGDYGYNTREGKALAHLYDVFNESLQCIKWAEDLERAAPTDQAADAFMVEVRAELQRARAKFPGDRIMCLALAEEFGELCKAVLDESRVNVRKEAVQTAVMAARVALDGDSSVREWREERGLDALVVGGAS